VHEPLAREEIERKFRSNAAYGGWDMARAEWFLQFSQGTLSINLRFVGFPRSSVRLKEELP